MTICKQSPLYKWRKDRGLSRSELGGAIASRCDVSRREAADVVSQMEAGIDQRDAFDRLIVADTLKRIAPVMMAEQREWRRAREVAA